VNPPNTPHRIKILYVAEIVGKAGIYALKKALPELKEREKVDFTLVCGDAATGGNGLGRNHAGYIRKLGADAITTGDCCFYKKDLVENWVPYVLRPSNFGRPGGGSRPGINRPVTNRPETNRPETEDRPREQVPGFGWRVFKLGGPGDTPADKSPSDKLSQDKAPVKVAAAVLLGANFSRLRPENPFTALRPLLEKLRAETPFIVLDFHAWASGEKRTLFAAASGLCTAVIGSHNRVQTADEAILDGTAVICDAGRTGSIESVGGTDTATRIREYLTGIPDWTKEAWDKCELQGVLIEADDQGRAISIQRVRVPVPGAKKAHHGEIE